MRKGFTMIELIFVIVILGILAAVAIPRLAATRDDAEISKAATNLTTLISDVGAYYTSQAKFSDKFADMTNVALTDGTTATVTNAAGPTGVIAAAGKKCLKVSLIGADPTGTQKPAYLKIEVGADADKAICEKVNKNSNVKKYLNNKFGWEKVELDPQTQAETRSSLESGAGEIAVSGVSVVF